MMWFRQERLTNLAGTLPELRPILPVLSQARQGVSFHLRYRTLALLLPSKIPMERLPFTA